MPVGSSARRSWVRLRTNVFIATAVLSVGLFAPATAAPPDPLIEIGPNWVSLGPEPVVTIAGGLDSDTLSPPVSGRATVFAVNPQNRYNVWLGTAGGGLWVTNNANIGGLTPATVKPDPSGGNFDRNWQPEWFPHNDGFKSLAIGSVVLDPSRCDVSGCFRAYVGTGENSLRRDTWYGDGVYRVEYSTGGEFPSWGWFRLDTAEQFKYGSTAGMVLDGSDLFVALAAGNTTTSVYANVRAPEPQAGYGVHRRDSSGNWTKVFATISHGTEAWGDLLLPTDIEKDPAGPNAFLLGVMNDGIFRTTDRGQTWCAMNPNSKLLAASQANQIPTAISNCSAGTGLPNAGTFDHVEIAIESASTLYAMFGNCPTGFTNVTQRGTSVCKDPDASGDPDTARQPWLYKSTDGGVTWTQPGAISGQGHYSRYTHALLSIGSGKLLWGGLFPYYLDTGATPLTQVDIRYGSLHWDVHALEMFGNWDAGAPVLYTATDGGFYFNANGAPGSLWIAGNESLITTQFTGIALDYEDEPDDALPRTTAILGGLQDNSNAAFNGSPKWIMWGPVGDGGEALIQTPAITYDSIQDNGIRRIPGCNFFSSYTGGPIVNNPEDVSFYSALTQHEVTKRVFVGTDVVSVRDGTPGAWSGGGSSCEPPAVQISPVLGTDGNSYQAIETDRDLITAVAVAPSHGWRVYVGLYSGKIWRSKTSPSVQPTPSSTDWMAAGSGLPAAPVSSIAVHPDHDDKLWVAFSGFVPQTVFYSDNSGQTWTARSSGLPAGEPVKVIKVVPNEPAKLWAGTDTGVYFSDNGGVSWQRKSANLPRVPVFDIEIDKFNKRVFAATHGRGVWMFTDAGPVITTFEGWMEEGIWDIPIYGTGFTCSKDGGCNCTVDVEREDATVCATGSLDATDSRIFVPKGDHILRTENQGSCTKCDGKPVVFACFNGVCVRNPGDPAHPLAACNMGGHRVSAVKVKCEENPVATGSVAGSCPEQSAPPSDLLEVTPGLSALGTGGSGGPAPTSSSSAQALIVAPTVLASTPNGGDRALCSALVDFSSATSEQIQTGLRDGINGSASCQAAGVTASFVQEVPLKGEDTPGASDLRIAIAAPGVKGSQMILGVAAQPGDAAGLCFHMSRLGVYLANQIAITQMRFPTGPGGAMGGEILVTEDSPVGTCTMRVPTYAGQTGDQIAQAIAQAFLTPGVPQPRSCPESNNPRDVVQDGDSIVTVLPTSMRACVFDEGVGFSFGPHGIPIAPPPVLEYAAKIVCGPQEEPKNMMLARGFYATTVNMHNPGPRQALITKTLALSYPPREQKQGELMRIGTDLIDPGRALKTDCMDIRERLFPDGFPTPAIEGFVVVQSNTSLDVTGVYTTATLDEKGRAKDHSSIQVLPVPARRIEPGRGLRPAPPIDREPGRPGKPGDMEPVEALLCYNIETDERVDAVVDLRTALAVHRKIPLRGMRLVCEPAFKTHREEELPDGPPDRLPLGCYGMTDGAVGSRVHLADRNRFYDGTAGVGRPEIFCDPARKVERKEEPVTGLEPFPEHLTGYRIKTGEASLPAVVYVRDHFGLRKITLLESEFLLEPTTKNDLKAPVPEEPVYHCYSIEKSGPANSGARISDQFGRHDLRVVAPVLFCDPAARDLMK